MKKLACTLLATYSSFMMACAIVLVFMGILCLAIPKQIASLVIKMFLQETALLPPP